MTGLEVRPVGHEPTSIYGFSEEYVDGNRLCIAKPTIRFWLALIAGPKSRRVHPGAPCLRQRIPCQNRPHLVSPRLE